MCLKMKHFDLFIILLQFCFSLLYWGDCDTIVKVVCDG